MTGWAFPRVAVLDLTTAAQMVNAQDANAPNDVSACVQQPDGSWLVAYANLGVERIFWLKNACRELVDCLWDCR